MIKKTFDSFYFLHIRKNGGRSYVHNFLDPLKPIIENSNITWLNPHVSGNQHNQWIKEITNLTYVTCTFREPCKQMVSTYVHNESFKSGNNINKENFLQWFDSDEGLYLHNNQSKNIVSPIITNEEGLFMYDEKITTKENVLNQISKISLFLKTEEITEKNCSTIQNKILLDLNIKDAKINNVKWNEDEYKSSHSKEIYDSLSKKEKEHITSSCSIDSEIYQTETLFWKR
jgi:hypothetical protein